MTSNGYEVEGLRAAEGCFLARDASGVRPVCRYDPGDLVYGDTAAMAGWLSSVVVPLASGAELVSNETGSEVVEGVQPIECCKGAAPGIAFELSESDAGGCYLGLFRQECRAQVAGKLLKDPTVRRLASPAYAKMLLPWAEISSVQLVERGGHCEVRKHDGTGVGAKAGGTAYSVAAVFSAVRAAAYRGESSVYDSWTVGGVGYDARSQGEKPCWAKLLDEVYGRDVTTGLVSAAAVIDRPGLVSALGPGGSTGVVVYRARTDVVCHVGDALPAGCELVRNVSLAELVVTGFAGAACRGGGVLPAFAPGYGWCGTCACCVKLDGHELRCQVRSPAIPGTSVTTLRDAAWMGDALHHFDVRALVLAARVPTVEATEFAQRYTSGKGQVAWYRGRGVPVHLEAANEVVLSTHFEAHYTAFRVEYVNWLADELGVPDAATAVLTSVDVSALGSGFDSLLDGRSEARLSCSYVGGRVFTPPASPVSVRSSASSGLVSGPGSVDAGLPPGIGLDRLVLGTNTVSIGWMWNGEACVLRCPWDGCKAAGTSWRSRDKFVNHYNNHGGGKAEVVPRCDDGWREVEQPRHGRTELRLDAKANLQLNYCCCVPGCRKAASGWVSLRGFHDHLTAHQLG